jgi:integration host factor subunit beta
MNKSQLIESVANKVGIPMRDSEAAVNGFFTILQQALANDERMEIRGFGTFKVKHYKAYIGRNPKSGSSIIVKAKKLPAFKPGKALKEMVNPGPQ